MTRKPPKAKNCGNVRPENSVGTISSMMEETPILCSALRALAWMPAHWPKASSSSPLALSVSMVRTAAHGGADQLALFEPPGCGCIPAGVAPTSRSASTLIKEMPTPSAASVTS